LDDNQCIIQVTSEKTFELYLVQLTESEKAAREMTKKLLEMKDDHDSENPMGRQRGITQQVLSLGSSIDPNRPIKIKELTGPNGVELKDGLFKGSVLVQWLLNNGFAIDRKNAGERAADLMAKEVFERIDGKSDFVDDDSLHQFITTLVQESCPTCGQGFPHPTHS